MMAAIVAAMTLALAAAFAVGRATAIAAFALSLALAIGLFLWEIHSPQTGFAMPWLRVQADVSTTAPDA